VIDRILKNRWWRPQVPGRSAGGSPRTPAPSPRKGAKGEAVDEAFLSRLRNLTLVSQPRLASGVTGEHSSPRRSNALEFTDYRSYAPGDDLRRVDWNVYMRLGQLFVRQSEAPERVNLHVLLDASDSMHWGNPDKFGYARRVAIGLSYIALSSMDRATLIALRGDGYVQVSRQESATATARLVNSASSLTPSGPTDLDASLGAYANRGNHRGVVVLISDLLSPSGYQAGLDRLSGAALRPIVIHVLSPEELNPQLEGDLELQDAETGATIQVSADRGTLTQYQKWLREWIGEIEQFCSSRGITYVQVDSSYPVEQLLLDRLRRERVLS
jgi:uncharacterized protein (DUF58 family)